MKATEKEKLEYIKNLTPLIKKISNSFYNQFSGMTFCKTEILQDMHQEAVCGILTALDRYDPTKSTAKFSTFAYWYILNAVQQYVASYFGVCRQHHAKISNTYRGLPIDDFLNDTDDNNLGLIADFDTVDIDISLDYEAVRAHFKDILTALEIECVLDYFGIAPMHVKANPLKKLIAENALIKIKEETEYLRDELNL